MGNAVIKTNTTTYFSDVRDFMEGWDCSIVEKTYSESRIDLYINGAAEPAISFLAAGLYNILIYGEEFNSLYHPDTTENIFLVVYSDTFFHLWIYGGGGASGTGMHAVRINYFYEKIGDSTFEGWAPNAGVWLDFACYDTIYNCPIFNKEENSVYVHRNWMNYSEVDNDIDMAPDFLFQFNSASEFDSPDLIACSTVPRHKVIVVDGKEYFSIEEHLLIPLFDESEDTPENQEET